MKITEMALLKIMHQRIAPNAPCMEHYSKAFFALCLNEQANSRDVQRLTELDEKCAQYVLGKLGEAGIVFRQENEFFIRLKENDLLELILETEQPERREKTWKMPNIIPQQKIVLPKTYLPLVCTIPAR